MVALTLCALGLGLGAGLIGGGQITQLAYLKVRYIWLVAALWLSQTALFLSPLGSVLNPWAAAIHFATLVVLGGVIVANRALPGFVLIAAGLLLNAAVAGSNGGFMPVSSSAMLVAGNQDDLSQLQDGQRIEKTTLMTEESPVWFLGDVFPFEPLHKVFSAGDLVAAAGVVLFVRGGMQTRRTDTVGSPATA